MARHSDHAPGICEVLCEEHLYERYFRQGRQGNFKQRNDEFKNRKSAAAIIGKTVKALDHMIDEDRIASIKVGGSVLVHGPTSEVLLRNRDRWGRCLRNCPECRQKTNKVKSPRENPDSPLSTVPTAQ